MCSDVPAAILLLFHCCLSVSSFLHLHVESSTSWATCWCSCCWESHWNWSTKDLKWRWFIWQASWRVGQRRCFPHDGLFNSGVCLVSQILHRFSFFSSRFFVQFHLWPSQCFSGCIWGRLRPDRGVLYERSGGKLVNIHQLLFFPDLHSVHLRIGSVLDVIWSFLVYLI